MEDLNFDGEPHALNEDTGYIMMKIDPCIEKCDLNVECLKVYRKYAEYMLAHDKEKVIRYFMRMFEHCLTFYQNFPDTNLIIESSNSLTPHDTIAIKFKRVQGDNLKES